MHIPISLAGNGDFAILCSHSYECNLGSPCSRSYDSAYSYSEAEGCNSSSRVLVEAIYNNQKPLAYRWLGYLSATVTTDIALFLDA